MNRDDYFNSMEQLLSDQSTYKEVKKDPINRLRSNINNLVKLWYKGEVIDTLTYKALNCTNGNLPRCYGLPKVHESTIVDREYNVVILEICR